MLASWTGTIIGPPNVYTLPKLLSSASTDVYPFHSFFPLFHFQSTHEGRIYTLHIHCDKDYPSKSPTVKFISRVNMTCVNQSTGAVTHSPPPTIKSLASFISLLTWFAHNPTNRLISAVSLSYQIGGMSTQLRPFLLACAMRCLQLTTESSPSPLKALVFNRSFWRL